MRHSRSPRGAWLSLCRAAVAHIPMRVGRGHARGFAHALRTLLISLLLGVMTAGCNKDSSEDLVSDKDMVAVPIGGVGHYGEGITVTEFSINGNRAGRIEAWGGGGAGHCCVLLPRQVSQPMIVTVNWATTRTDVNEFREHTATVPIHFEVQPGDGGTGLYVHFLPGHRVEVWYPRDYPESTSFEGPKFPTGLAPPYETLPNETFRRKAPHE